jgi:integrase
VPSARAQGRVWVKAPDGRILISIEGYNLWAEAGPASAPSATARSKSPSPIVASAVVRGSGSSPTPANLKRATRHRAAILDAIETQHVRLRDMEAHLKRSTWDDYRKIVNHTIVPALGRTLLTELKRSAIRDWLFEVAASNKRLANIQSFLRSALQDAVNDGVIEANHYMAGDTNVRTR